MSMVRNGSGAAMDTMDLDSDARDWAIQADLCLKNMAETEAEISRELDILCNIYRVRRGFRNALTQGQAADLDRCAATIIRNLCNSAARYSDITEEYEEVLASSPT